MRHIIPISGKDSCATAIVQIARKPDLPYELFFTDVGAELPETYQWLDKVENTLCRPVKRVGKSLVDIIYGEGILPAPNTRFCTRLAKIEPMEDFIGDDDATVYFGIRADEDRLGYQAKRHNIVSVSYPLKEMGIGLPQVYKIVGSKGLQPPKFFWQRVYDGVLSILEKEWRNSFQLGQPPKDLLDSLPEYVFDRLFAWRTRSNCFFCFFQRVYEWVGLLEHHPDLFTKAEEIENTVGNNEQERPYTWIDGLSLAQLRRQKDEVVAKRIRQIVKELQTKRFDDPEDMLTVTSCGLFCGK